MSNEGTKTIIKAVIPVAGLGTRFLPVTKAIPKEMLPLIDVPVIDFVVRDAILSGMSQILMVTGRNKAALENYFDGAFEIESHLAFRGETEKLKAIKQPSELADIHYVRQGGPLGLGHAITKAEQFVSGDFFAVLLGDDVIENGGDLMSEMAAISNQYGAFVVAIKAVCEEDIEKFGIVDGTFKQDGKLFEIKGLVEKPHREEAPSNYAVIGRYILGPQIFPALNSIQQKSKSELSLTEALDYVAKGFLGDIPVIGYLCESNRFDTGDKLGYSKAFVEFAMKHENIGEEFKQWLGHLQITK